MYTQGTYSIQCSRPLYISLRYTSFLTARVYTCITPTPPNDNLVYPTVLHSSLWPQPGFGPVDSHTCLNLRPMEWLGCLVLPGARGYGPPWLVSLQLSGTLARHTVAYRPKCTYAVVKRAEKVFEIRKRLSPSNGRALWAYVNKDKKYDSIFFGDKQNGKCTNWQCVGLKHIFTEKNKHIIKIIIKVSNHQLKSNFIQITNIAVY